jgi:hypothetical protein
MEIWHVDGRFGRFSGTICLVNRSPPDEPVEATPAPATETPAPATSRELGGRNGPEPTRYGDWELRGRCIDF